MARAAMISGKLRVSAFSAASLTLLAAFWSIFFPGDTGAAQARSRRRGHVAATTHSSRSSGRSRGSHHAHAAATPKHSARQHTAAAKPKYAYPLDFFMMRAPEFDRSPLDEALSAKIKDAFNRGIADDVAPAKMVRAGIFHHYPLSGGIFRRREEVKYIVLHSTETGVPVPGKNVINGWNSMGRRHPGAQFVVDRDGTILQAVDPELATVHVNIFKTLPGINNDNTIGIEMNHTGRQDYPAAQRQAVMRLLTYLQQRFRVTSDNVITHRYAQQGDHTDPVNFDLENFLAQKEDFRTRAIALKRSSAPFVQPDEDAEEDLPVASVYVQIHGPLSETELSKSLSSEPPMAMPKGTFVAGGPLQPGSSPASEATATKPAATPASLKQP